MADSRREPHRSDGGQSPPREGAPRPRKKRHRVRKGGCALRILAALLLLAGVYALMTSSLFLIDKIEVKGNQHYTAEQIVALAKAKAGVNLFKAPTGKMRDRLEKEPYIRQASINRKLPHTLILKVDERVARAALKYGDAYLLIDETGFILEQTPTPPKLTLISGMKLSTTKPGEVLKVDQPEMLADALALVRAMAENECFFKAIELSKNRVKAYIYDTLSCEGEPDQLLKGMDGLPDMLYDLYKQDIKRGVIRVGKDGYFAFSPAVE